MSVSLANLTNSQIDRAREGFTFALLDIGGEPDVEEALVRFLMDLERRRRKWQDNEPDMYPEPIPLRCTANNYRQLAAA